MESQMAEAANATPLDGKYSCQVCHKRKVKCDRRQPCSTCRKGNVECVYLAPAPPRRRKRTDEKTLLAKLRRYEEHLKRAGIAIEKNMSESPTDTSAMEDVHESTEQDRDANSQPAVKAQNESRTVLSSSPFTSAHPQTVDRFLSGATGRFVVDNSGKSRYLENNLWVTLNEELRDPQQIVQEQGKDAAPDDSDEDDNNTDLETGRLLFETPKSDRELRRQYLQPEVIDILWDTYIRNVDPICKILHVPTFQKVIDLAKKNINEVPKNELALLFSVYHFAITSMSTEVFERTFTQPRKYLLAKFRCLTQQALINVGFLRSSDLTTLQAYLQYLLSVRLVFDSQTVWTLSGICFRIARRLGLHRDGEAHGLPPFEVEMRRRLWLQLLILDHTSAELAGSAPTFWSMMKDTWDTKRPHNINDTDINSSATEFPPERHGPTEMIFVLLRHKFGEYFRENLRAIRCHDPLEANWQGIGSSFSLAEKDKFVDRLEQELEQNFIRYCDPLQPLHYLCMLAARSAVTGMRLRSHHPRQYSDKGASLPQEEKDMLFRLALKIIQYDNLLHSTDIMQCFRWHIKSYFQWHGFIYLLSELRYRRVGEDADIGWKEVTGVFEHHSEIMENRRYILHAAVLSLTLKAWDCREAERRKLGFPIQVPEFINKIRTLTGSSKSKVVPSETQGTAKHERFITDHINRPQGNQSRGGSWWTEIFDANSGSASTGSIGEPTPIDWTQWDSILQAGDAYHTDFFDYDNLYLRA